MHDTYLQELCILLLGFLLAICPSCLCLFMLEADQSDNEASDIEQGFSRYDSSEDDEIAKQQQQPLTEVLWGAGVPVEEHQNEDKEEEKANISSQCCICLEEFKKGDQCKVRSKCNHIYHAPCIDVWLLWNKLCPLCRGYVQVD